ncbi:hypothetical protein [Spiroplasma endosymbiont of Polydrusus formosus]|uniref:hypothetical protein n=1 Tax=Spiroplasma endosymbiont of Polydrusus formosus TaxID=3139326 RepID=UPI0035B50467
MANIHKKGIGKNLLLNINLMRYSKKIYHNKLLNILHQTPIKLNNVFNHLNPNFYIKKVTKKLLAPIEKQIIAIKQKVISKITEQTKKYCLNLKLRLLKNGGQLLPFCLWFWCFLAVKIVLLSIAERSCALTIYYKNNKYDSIVVMTTLIKAEQLILTKKNHLYIICIVSDLLVGDFKKQVCLI